MSVADGPLGALLEQVWRDTLALETGEVATYIPELENADPATFGLSLATLDGHVYDVGDQVPFTIQSVSKPFVYALALADSGHEAVLAKVGNEPTGDPFNSISVDLATSRASNPMVNAGAIVTTSLVGGATRDEQLERIVGGLSAFAGRRLEIDETVYESERRTGDRNRAIAYFMRSLGLLDDDVDAQVELYFRQCSVVVTAHDLAVMAATLANGGLNPVTDEQVVPRSVVASVLTVMTTCGMYDYAGEWLYRVGLPAKSGVSGGVAAALPGQLGLGVQSPRLDARGNSVRGVAAAERISSALGLHLLLPVERARSGIRRAYRDDVVRSRRGRPREHQSVLDSHGSAIEVVELAGDLGFAGAELLARHVLDADEPTTWRVLDLHRVTRVEAAAETILRELAEQQEALGVELAVVEPRREPARSSVRAVPGRRFADADSALEWAETSLLEREGIVDELPDGLVPLALQDLLHDLAPDLVDEIASRTTTRVLTAGTVAFAEGAEPDGLWFVSAGQVMADVRTRRGRRRLASTSAGSSFGELALVDGGRRSARVVALEPTICHILSVEAYDDLRKNAPSAAAALTLSIARLLSGRLRYATADLAAFDEV